ncbi:MAG: aldehyde dehydrogenase family protein, partial [Syntrophobacteraceae bacterium]
MNQTAQIYEKSSGQNGIEQGAWMPVLDKFSGEVIQKVPLASPEDVERAIASAHEAFPRFSRTPAHIRSGILNRAADLLEKRREELATLLCREIGKPWKYSSLEVSRTIEIFRMSAEEAKRIHGETVPMDASAFGEGRFGFYLRSPIGVVAAITPFNFPLSLVAHKGLRGL